MTALNAVVFEIFKMKTCFQKKISIEHYQIEFSKSYVPFLYHPYVVRKKTPRGDDPFQFGLALSLMCLS
jgi:hypothetical protein